MTRADAGHCAADSNRWTPRLMKAQFWSALMCSILGLCECVGVTQPQEGPSVDGSPESRLRLQIKLKDGSDLLGEPKTEALAFHTYSTRIRIPINDMRRITFLQDNETARVDLLGGDVLTCVPLFDSLAIETVLGEREIRIGTIRFVGIVNHTLYVSQRGMHGAGFARWSTAASNVQDAVNAASDGDTILVSNGTYFAAGEITLKKALILRSVNGPGATVIDGSLTGRCVFIQHTNAVLDGFTLFRGSTSGDGGGAYVDGGTVRNCDIASNQCIGGWSMGGGVALVNGGRLECCRIRDNVGKRGGGAYVGRGSRMTGCTILSNRATGEWGGGVMVTGGGELDGCHIVSNQAPRDGGASGGGVAVVNGGYVRRCRIESNMASSHGAGVSLSGLEPCVLKESVVYRNGRPSGSGCGGGVYLPMGGAVIEDSLVVRNHDPMYAGGVNFYNGGVVSGRAGTVINCTIAMNSSPHGNEVSGHAPQGLLCNSIVFNEAADNLCYGRGLFFSNCWVSAKVAGTNNVLMRPEFVDYANDNFSLDPSFALQGVGCPLYRLTNVCVGVEDVPLVPSSSGNR